MKRRFLVSILWCLALCGCVVFESPREYTSDATSSVGIKPDAADYHNGGDLGDRHTDVSRLILVDSDARANGRVMQDADIVADTVSVEDADIVAEVENDYDVDIRADGNGDYLMDVDLDVASPEDSGGTMPTDADHSSVICVPKAELCNGRDDDCDPSTPDGADEIWLGNPCDGADTDWCDEGVLLCIDANPSCDDMSEDDIEICNDQDEDCDGNIDGDAACGECRVEYFSLNRYLFCDFTLTWQEARNHCIKHGYDLLILETKDENDWAWNTASELNSNKDWWIGLQSNVDNGNIWWRWVNETLAGYTNFGYNQPNGIDGECVELRDNLNSAWNDDPCGYSGRFICETLHK